ncbi:hypothetical protein EC204B2_05300 [Escherichia coli]|nr:hypothetical protein EC204B2_05300 [Escherichia coli]
MTSLKTSIKTITYLSDIGCLEIQGASLVTTAAYAVGYESYPISVGNIRGCLESHPREILPG